MKITEKFLKENATGGIGWTNAQIAIITSDKSKGWLKKAIGKELSEEDAKKFIELGPKGKDRTIEKTKQDEWMQIFHLLNLKGEKYYKEVLNDLKDIIEWEKEFDK